MGERKKFLVVCGLLVLLSGSVAFYALYVFYLEPMNRNVEAKYYEGRCYKNLKDEECLRYYKQRGHHTEL